MSAARRNVVGLFGATLACVMGYASVSHASTTATYTASVSMETLEWSHALSVPKFDSTLGTLESVTLTLGGNILANLKLENQDQTPHTIKASDVAYLNLLSLSSSCVNYDPRLDPNYNPLLPSPSPCVLLVTYPAVTVNFDATAYDGSPDYGGTSGITYPAQNGADSRTFTTTSSSTLAYFVGSGNVSIPVATVGYASMSGASNALYSVDTQASADLTVVYTYSPTIEDFGDPHLITVDGFAYDFHAFGDFHLVKDTQYGLSIQGRQTEVPSQPGLAWNAAVAVGFIGTSGNQHRLNVVAVIGADGLATFAFSIDGVAKTIANPGKVTIDGYSLVKSGMYAILSNKYVRVQFSAMGYEPMIDVKAFFKGPRKGLLGDGDGNPFNDLQLRDGTLVDASTLYTTFAQDWLVQAGESLFDDQIAPAGAWSAGQIAWPSAATFSVPDRILTVDSLPAAVRAEAEESCKAAGAAPGYVLDSCTFDVGMLGDLGLASRYADVKPPLAVLTMPKSATLEPEELQGHGFGCTFATGSQQVTWSWAAFVAMAASGMLFARRRRS